MKYTITGAGFTGTYTVGSLRTFVPAIPSGSFISTISLTFQTTRSNQSMIVDVDLTSAGITQNVRVRPPIGDPAQPACASMNAGCFEAGSVIKFNDCFVQNCFRLSSTFYAELKRDLDNGYFITTNGIFRFKFNEEYNKNANGKLSFRIYDDLHKLLYNASTATTGAQFNSSYGTQYYALDLSGCDQGIVYSGYYTIEVENEKKELWRARIKNTRTGPGKWVSPCATGPIHITPGGLGGE
jgi:hypothetical protein